MEPFENLTSDSPTPSSFLTPTMRPEDTLAASSEAEARSLEEYAATVDSSPPPQKRCKPAIETTVEEASSSTSPTSRYCTTIARVVPIVETAEATPTKQSSPLSQTGNTTEPTGSSRPISPPATSSTLRKFRKIPIFIVDYHNDVLAFLYRSLASHHLPLENNILVHFDSHPDMVINRCIPASASYDKDVMLERLSIESWIMPLCFTGQFNRVVWIKNSWCTQIPVGKYYFKVGQKDDKICVDSNLDYFMSEGSYCAASEMEESRDLELQVLNADTDDLLPDFISAADAHSFVLDIDLDFFSTSNPFLDIYGQANCYERLTEIFKYETSPNDCHDTSERRQQQLNELRIIFEHLEVTQSVENLPASVFEVIPESTIEKIRLLKVALEEDYCTEEIDWLLIYDSGCTTDSNGLPHHVSTKQELETYYQKLKTFLERLPVLPVAITMACSASDDYCPQSQVQEIQDRVLNIFQQVFGERVHAQPIRQYMEDEWDVMKL